MIKFEKIKSNEDLVLGATYSDIGRFSKMTTFLVFEGIRGKSLAFSESPLNKRKSPYLVAEDGKIHFFVRDSDWWIVSDEQMSEIASQKI